MHELVHAHRSVVLGTQAMSPTSLYVVADRVAFVKLDPRKSPERVLTGRERVGSSFSDGASSKLPSCFIA